MIVAAFSTVVPWPSRPNLRDNQFRWGAQNQDASVLVVEQVVREDRVAGRRRPERAGETVVGGDVVDGDDANDEDDSNEGDDSDGDDKGCA